MSPSETVDLVSGPDLHPLYPTSSDIEHFLLTNSGISSEQKLTFVTHCMTRACIFADPSLLQNILNSPHVQPFLDLNYRDDDGLVYSSVTIIGFGASSDRDVEREECVRLLVAEGANINISDKAGWTSLHYAALLAPPTLISHLLMHGCSPLSMTNRNLTALDIVTAYSVIPGRETAALFLEEAMRSVGWKGSQMAIKRRNNNQRLEEKAKLREQRKAISHILELNGQWWRSDDLPLLDEDSDEAGDSDSVDESIYTPPLDFASMLVFSPAALPGIFESLVTRFQPSARNAHPANALYLLARFACLQCDHTWLEDLIMGATDAIEDVIFDNHDDLRYTTFWLFNCTVLLHLLRCDTVISETCDLVGTFDLIEEVINAVYVLIIRVAERRIDKLVDTVILDHSPAQADLEAIQFEWEWSIFRSPFSSKKKPPLSRSVTPSSTSASLPTVRPGSPGPQPFSRPTSPTAQQNGLSPKALKSGPRANHTRGSSAASLQDYLSKGPPPAQSPQELTIFLSALHLFLTESDINPAIITQLWSQVMYWTSSEVFNRLLTRKRYLCRSRAAQISSNISVLEQWIEDAGLPRGINLHFSPTRQLLLWLQCLSSMNDFSNLIATIQSMKHLNPLQMRRAVRDYRYEINESRMSDDCSQYLAQLQKDWERQRVRLGVEALRKEINDRDEDMEDGSTSSEVVEMSECLNRDKSISSDSVEDLQSPKNAVDILFELPLCCTIWIPQQPPEVLGELLESRYMLPLALPSPRMLASVSGIKMEGDKASSGGCKNCEGDHTMDENKLGAPKKREGRRILDWVMKCHSLRQISIELLDWLDGTGGSGSWTRRIASNGPEHDLDDDGGSSEPDESKLKVVQNEDARPNRTRLTRLVRTASSRAKHDRSDKQDLGFV